MSRSRVPAAPSMPVRRAHRGAPRRVAVAVDRLAERLTPMTELARVQAAWPSVCNALPMAAEGDPCALRDRVLTVRCSASVYAQELQLAGEDLIVAVNGALGESAVSALRVRAR